MERKSFQTLRDLALVCLTAALVVLSFPDFDISRLVWIALVPLFVVLSQKRPVAGFFLAHICGMLIILGSFRWILEVDRYAAIHHALLVVYFGLYAGLFGLVFCLISRLRSLNMAFATAPFVWVALEYTKSNLSFLSLPWLLLSHSQYAETSVIQMAAVTGAHGTSFLIVLVNAAIAMLTIEMVRRLREGLLPGSDHLTLRATLVMMFFAGASGAAALLYGNLKLSTGPDGSEFRISVVQANIAQENKWDRRHAEAILTAHEDLSRRALIEKPDLIVWPETATPGSITKNRRLNARIRSLAEELKVPLLVGSSQHRKFGTAADARLEFKNSAFLIPPRRGPVKHQHYNKNRLLPFGEYLPLKEKMPWDLIGIDDVGGYTAGNELAVFELNGVRFATTICWENIFPDLVREFVNNGAQFIINITNEAWFGKTAAPYQFLSMSVLRAVENGVFVVRCANTGISAFIDPNGRVYSRVAGEQGEDIFVSGVRTDAVIPAGSKTFYTRYGDWAARLSIAVTTIAIVGALVFRKRAN